MRQKRRAQALIRIISKILSYTLINAPTDDLTLNGPNMSPQRCGDVPAGVPPPGHPLNHDSFILRQVLAFALIPDTLALFHALVPSSVFL
ncbi:MAG: hypothetical protein ACI8TQ_003299 [Planctomycetota bacterium]|jgi:hypothetical protein